MEKRLICVSCPVGCEISVKTEGDKVVEITGNRCPRGETYARQETIAPMRVLPTSVKVLNGEWPLVSVKTDHPVPKDLIAKIMERVRTLAVEAPVGIGQVIAENLLGTDANLVATRNIHRIRNGDGRDSPST
jgi:CxxC motif-containing protein